MTRLWQRIIANSKVPEGQLESTGCWEWTGAIGNGYPRMNFYVEGHYAQLRAHRVALVLLELQGEEKFFYELYLHYSASGLEADHICKNPYCVNPDHLIWASGTENLRRRKYSACQAILQPQELESGRTPQAQELDSDLPDFPMTRSTSSTPSPASVATREPVVESSSA